MASKNPGFNIPLRDPAPRPGWQRKQHQEFRMRGSIASQPEARPPEAPGPCAHHWRIETPNGTFSDGVCRKCGAEKQFRNSSEDLLFDGGHYGQAAS